VKVEGVKEDKVINKRNRKRNEEKKII